MICPGRRFRVATTGKWDPIRNPHNNGPTSAQPRGEAGLEPAEVTDMVDWPESQSETRPWVQSIRSGSEKRSPDAHLCPGHASPVDRPPTPRSSMVHWPAKSRSLSARSSRSTRATAATLHLSGRCCCGQSRWPRRRSSGSRPASTIMHGRCTVARPTPRPSRWRPPPEPLLP